METENLSYSCFDNHKGSYIIIDYDSRATDAIWKMTINNTVSLIFTLLMFKSQELVFLMEWCKWVINIESNDEMYGNSENLSLNSNSSMYIRGSMSILICS